MSKKTLAQNGLKSKKGLSETQLAWVLVAPALIVICAIALFPVLRTFYLSLFDLRLNHPSKNQTQFSYQINIERWADANYRFDKTIKACLETETDRFIVSELEDIQSEYSLLIEQVSKDAAVKEQYQQVWDLQAAMATIPDALQYAKVDELQTKNLREKVLDLQKRLYALEETASDGKSVKLAAQIYDDILYAIVSPNFVGLENYFNYFKDDRMWSSLGRTLWFAGCAVAFEMIIGLAIAVLMNRTFKGRGIVRATVLVPWAIPASVSALIWRFMYDGQYGVVSTFFASIGIVDSPGQVLTDGTTAMFALTFADIWKTSPYVSLLLLAGLQSIDTSYLEAARVDGANKVQAFFKITLPMLKPSILVALMFRSMDALRVFDLVSVMTGGGPSNGTEVISLYTYKTMFGNMLFGQGSALSVIIFICLAVFCICYIKILGVDLIKVDK